MNWPYFSDEVEDGIQNPHCSAVFFSYNKSINNTFCHDFSEQTENQVAEGRGTGATFSQAMKGTASAGVRH